MAAEIEYKRGIVWVDLTNVSQVTPPDNSGDWVPDSLSGIQEAQAITIHGVVWIYNHADVVVGQTVNVVGSWLHAVTEESQVTTEETFLWPAAVEPGGASVDRIEFTRDASTTPITSDGIAVGAAATYHAKAYDVDDNQLGATADLAVAVGSDGLVGTFALFKL